MKQKLFTLNTLELEYTQSAILMDYLIWEKRQVKNFDGSLQKLDVLVYKSEECTKDYFNKIDPTLEPEKFLQTADRNYFPKSYNAFEEGDIIPSLSKMVLKVWKGKNKKDAIKKWVGKWGFLGNASSHCIVPDCTGEVLDDFWSEAEQLASLWNLYGDVTQEGFEKTRLLYDDLIRVFPDPIVTDDSKLLYKFIFGKVMAKLRGETWLGGGEIITVKTTKNNTFFNARPIIKCSTLLHALYLQLYYFLTDNTSRKICPTCGKIFPPDRTNQVHCGKACYNTGKNRRWRNKESAK